MLRYILFFGLLLGLLSSLSAQILTEPFTADLTANGWTTTGTNFSWTADGTAAAIIAADWRNRSRLRSISRGGAALHSGAGTASTLLSPMFDAAGPELYLTFYHYLRSETGTLQVRVLGTNGVEYLRTIVVPNLEGGAETSSGKFEIIDLSSVLADPQPYQIEFSVTGDVFFWMVDDISVVQERPNYPTFPRYVGEQLDNFGISFVTDSLGAAAVPFELVIDFADGVTQADKDAIRQQLGAMQKETCVCDRIELWVLPGGVFFDPASGEPLGDPGEILEGTLGSNSSGNVDNIELNLLNYHELQNVPAVPNAPLIEELILGLSAAPAAAVKIAVLDTGVDLDHPKLVKYLFRNDDGLGNNLDDDANCYADDVIGWNFVDNNNNPSDDHSHGSHVAGIIAQNIADCENCSFQIIPYKTHNSYGVGTLFATSCATLQAGVMDGADVINASWGFYGGGSDILKAAIDTVGDHGALVVAAAGNDSLNLIADQQHPATFPLSEIIGVGTFEVQTTGLGRAEFSNYNPQFIDLFAEGIDIFSSIPDNDIGVKTGTSMSTPAVAAAAALHICDEGANPVVTKNYLLVNADQFPLDLGEFVLDGNVLNADGLCVDDDDVGELRAVNSSFSLCLLDGGNTLGVLALQHIVGADIEVNNDAGGLLTTRSNVSITEGEQLVIDLSSSPANEYVVVIRYRGRTLVQRLAIP